MHTLSLQTKATIYSVFSIKVIGLHAIIVILSLVLLLQQKNQVMDTTICAIVGMKTLVLHTSSVTWKGRYH